MSWRILLLHEHLSQRRRATISSCNRSKHCRTLPNTRFRLELPHALVLHTAARTAVYCCSLPHTVARVCVHYHVTQDNTYTPCIHTQGRCLVFLCFTAAAYNYEHHYLSITRRTYSTIVKHILNIYLITCCVAGTAWTFTKHITQDNTETPCIHRKSKCLVYYVLQQLHITVNILKKSLYTEITRSSSWHICPSCTQYLGYAYKHVRRVWTIRDFFTIDHDIRNTECLFSFDILSVTIVCCLVCLYIFQEYVSTYLAYHHLHHHPQKQQQQELSHILVIR